MREARVLRVITMTYIMLLPPYADERVADVIYR